MEFVPRNQKLINTEAASVLLECSKHIARWAKKGDAPLDDRTPVQRRAHENAWRLLSSLITFAEHTKESDLYWLLASMAEEQNKPPREQARLRAIAKMEDSGYLKAKKGLEQLLAEILKEERDDPKATKQAGDMKSQSAANGKSRTGQKKEAKLVATAQMSSPETKPAKPKAKVADKVSKVKVTSGNKPRASTSGAAGKKTTAATPAATARKKRG